MKHFSKAFQKLFTVILHPPQEVISPSYHETSFTDCDVDVLNKPSMEHFWTKYFHLHRPVKLTSCIDHWPAMSKWKDFNYLMKIAAYRTVPIELGRAYDDDDWGQNLFLFGDFVKECLSKSDYSENLKAYLAQHDLFDQIPSLREDFHVPDYCAISSHEPIMKSWIGPKGKFYFMPQICLKINFLHRHN